ncbi:hypothetical protein FIV42_26350 [Persicimonas caeni]|uniref:Uncharacterized protein n=1 Tax=Persicimonas caeni TaxID=2292766 RepID=A0A4Y6Q2B2_PERCE|nr:hypothetical protein [Persicimonas caeni]QDG54135.1 hypothetical protein FIV42_26350 [Persicimonas caeni]QED35356.1 hypothetical protein FRD00_26345 [Persicimonas caeni]
MNLSDNGQGYKRLTLYQDKARQIGGSLQRWYTIYLHQVDAEEGAPTPLPDLDSLMVDIED